MPSAHFAQLSDNLNVAQGILARVPDMSCRTQLQGLSLQSYILLAHGAFETYLENVVKDALEKAVKSFESNGAISKLLVSLLVSQVMADLSAKSKRKIQEDTARSLSLAVKDAKRAFSGIVKANNGIKSENLCTLFFPIGVDPQEVSIEAFNALNTFGTNRGAIAHGFEFIRQEHSKTSVLGEIQTIMTYLPALESAVNASLNTEMKEKFVYLPFGAQI